MAEDIANDRVLAVRGKNQAICGNRQIISALTQSKITARGKASLAPFIFMYDNTYIRL
jgi:hypothetical protein